MRQQQEELEVNEIIIKGFKVLKKNKEVDQDASTYMSLLASKDRDFLLSPTGTQVKISDLEDKVIGIYFSANWYPQCQTFNTLLIDTYEQLKENTTTAAAAAAASTNAFEVVFVSSDEDLNAFNNYRASMPWLAIPFSDLETKVALSRKFDVEGIPCLIILQPNHNDRIKDNDDEEDTTILHDGVEVIYRYGIEAFPFTKERLEELGKEERQRHESQTLSSLLTSHDRDFLLAHHPSPQQVPVTSLMGKTVGLYFSAQWALPCMKFTPKLISIYQKIKEMIAKNGNNEDYEIIFVSSDREETEFSSYFDTMPWLALPFGDTNIKFLTKYFDIRGIPSLVILGPGGKTVTKNGRNLINLYEQNAFPFTEARVEYLEKKMDDELKSLPRSELHVGHCHELTLVSEGSGGGPFICCDCDEQGSGWAYQCIECGYEVHPKCMRAVDPGLTVADS